MHRGGLFTVTRYGALRLSYADLDGSWNQTTTELAAVDSGENLLTHAAFSYELGKKLTPMFAPHADRLQIGLFCL